MSHAPLLLSSLLFLAAACGGNSPPPEDPVDAASAVDAPAAPRISATVTPASVPPGASFRMQVTVENFEIVNPMTTPGAMPGKGHFHYQLDTAPNYTAAWYTQVNVATAASTPPGEHTLRLWLVDGNHVELQPLVETTLTVTVE